jgi:hypothetical protein
VVGRRELVLRREIHGNEKGGELHVLGEFPGKSR